ncbi:hypothetical protein MLD38_007448 [Melastoma candidum]|uniref:Uncharacterized protein n=1 Tax=Melastoma candidum TaxID=119954 RepID=A0ACB9RQT5_9MYRT|nr:hypothetical protein MLD38_007448 [Melastoma candidum]
MSITRRCLRQLERCKSMSQLRQSHAQVVTTGLGDDAFALSRLLAFCSNPQRGSLAYSWDLFRNILNPTICIFNTMIKSLFLSKEFGDAVRMFKELLERGMYPDGYTLPYVIGACAKLGAFRVGGSLHCYGAKVGLVYNVFVVNALTAMYCGDADMKVARQLFDESPERCVVTSTVMIDGYAKMGDVDGARLIFDKVFEKDVGVWGAMISGYVHNGCFKEGLHMFRLMQLEGIVPDEAMLVSTLCACSNLGELDVGIWIHRYVENRRLPISARLGTGLIDMYAKCGRLDLAKKLFEEVPNRDVACWNAMISGFAVNGDGGSALRLFSEMEEGKIMPDDITLIAILTACSHSGMATQGLKVLRRFVTVHNLIPKSRHYGSLVELLSQAGLLDEATELLLNVSYINDTYEEVVAWRALLTASCKHGKVKLAELAAQRLFDLDCHSGAYILLSNMYAACGQQNNVRIMRKVMKHRGVGKVPGCSSLQINGQVFEFVAGEKTHSRTEEICYVINNLNKQANH